MYKYPEPNSSEKTIEEKLIIYRKKNAKWYQLQEEEGAVNNSNLGGVKSGKLNDQRSHCGLLFFLFPGSTLSSHDSRVCPRLSCSHSSLSEKKNERLLTV